MDKYFTIENGMFSKDGNSFRVISGEIHYFRIMRPHWSDRLQKLKDFGCNTVSTAVPWVLHEPEEGSFNFSDNMDLSSFIQAAEDLDLCIILRIGPFIGCDVDRGGLPGWLSKYDSRLHRSSDPRFMKRVESFYRNLSAHIADHTYTKGGSVIMLQIEQEYRSYGLDYRYLNALRKICEDSFPNTLIFTSDIPGSLLPDNKSSDIFTALNFGSNVKEAFLKVEQFAPGKPKFCMEFWTGWQDAWGGAHYVRSAESMARSFDELLALNASINIYMFAGGTNFGFLSGALTSDRFEPGTTSYDYDALVSESGECTEKYYVLHNILKKHITLPSIQKKKDNDFFEKKNIIFPSRAELFKTVPRISQSVRNGIPLSMDSLGQYHGFILYRTTIKGPIEDAILTVNGLHDRAQIFINEKYSETIYRNESHSGCIIDINDSSTQLDILVENMGGISNTTCSNCYKGITQHVLLNGKIVFDWEIFSLTLDTINAIPFASYSNDETLTQPAFYQAMFAVEKPKNSFLSLRGWKKGICFINGFNLGRYWNEGPQQNLYVPAPLLRKGKNEIILFELYQPSDLSIEFVSESNYGRKSPIRKSISSRSQQSTR